MDLYNTTTYHNIVHKEYAKSTVNRNRDMLMNYSFREP